MKLIWMLISCRASLRSTKRANSFCARSIEAFAKMKADGSLRQLHEKYGLMYGY